jgi:hypothetical protein
MNPWTAQALAHSHHRDLHREAANAHPAPGRLPRTRRRATPLRTRLTEHAGHALVEAGLHLLATAAPRS